MNYDKDKNYIILNRDEADDISRYFGNDWLVDHIFAGNIIVLD